MPSALHPFSSTAPFLVISSSWECPIVSFLRKHSFRWLGLRASYTITCVRLCLSSSWTSESYFWCVWLRFTVKMNTTVTCFRCNCPGPLAMSFRSRIILLMIAAYCTSWGSCHLSRSWFARTGQYGSACSRYVIGVESPSKTVSWHSPAMESFHATPTR